MAWQGIQGGSMSLCKIHQYLSMWRSFGSAGLEEKHFEARAVLCCGTGILVALWPE